MRYDDLPNAFQQYRSGGFVYLLKPERMPCKIGKTVDARHRVRSLAGSLPYPIELVHVIVTEDSSEAEVFFHLQFADKRLNGEWFDLSAEDIASFTKHRRLTTAQLRKVGGLAIEPRGARDLRSLDEQIAACLAACEAAAEVEQQLTALSAPVQPRYTYEQLMADPELRRRLTLERLRLSRRSDRNSRGV